MNCGAPPPPPGSDRPSKGTLSRVKFQRGMPRLVPERPITI